MAPGDLVSWKYRIEMDLPCEFGTLIKSITEEHDPFPYWKVLFPGRGVLQCRESDLVVV